MCIWYVPLYVYMAYVNICVYGTCQHMCIWYVSTCVYMAYVNMYVYGMCQHMCIWHIPAYVYMVCVNICVYGICQHYVAFYRQSFAGKNESPVFEAPLGTMLPPYGGLRSWQKMAGPFGPWAPPSQLENALFWSK